MPRDPRRPRKSDPQRPLRLPIKLDPVSNGEFEPPPVDPRVRTAQALAWEQALEGARRLGMDRRAFLASACGAATTLLAMNRVLGDERGGFFDLPAIAQVDEDAAKATLEKRELIFDVQTHHVATKREWDRHDDTYEFIKTTPQGRCGKERAIDCYSADTFVREVFLDSDTDAAVLSMQAQTPKGIPLNVSEAAQTRELVARSGKGRLYLHAVVVPNLDPLEAQLDQMQADAEAFKIAGFKLYTIWGPKGRGWWLDDEKVGIPVIEQARRVGVPILCLHKGIPLRGQDPTFTRCRDVGVVAKRFPDMQFLIYHSGYEHGVTEREYRGKEVGIDGLIKSMKDNGIRPNSNVWAELGSLWRELMKKPTEAAHALGKLLVHVGEDRVVWGTDAIWYGSPQDQIEALRAFQISEALREKNGYPALTPALKAKIFGLNGARAYGLDPKELHGRLQTDDLGRFKHAYQEAPDPSLRTYGPTTRRGLLRLLAGRGGLPG